VYPLPTAGPYICREDFQGLASLVLALNAGQETIRLQIAHRRNGHTGFGQSPWQTAPKVDTRSVRSTQTKVEVLEYLPEIWLGKVFDPMGHSGPGFYYDIREVGPTEADRTELLEIIRQTVPGSSASVRMRR
jgi:hypothetical protein